MIKLLHSGERREQFGGISAVRINWGSQGDIYQEEFNQVQPVHANPG